jgi:hypothetical protein
MTLLGRPGGRLAPLEAPRQGAVDPQHTWTSRRREGALEGLEVVPQANLGDGRIGNDHHGLPGASSPGSPRADETTDIGEDFGMPVSSDYSGGTSRFNGKIDLVQIDLGDDNHDHPIGIEEVIRIAMARQ